MSDQDPTPPDTPRPEPGELLPPAAPPPNAKKDWLQTVARATETVAPLVARPAPKPEDIPTDTRGRWATILAIAGILVAVFQFLAGFYDLLMRPLGPLLGALPYIAAVLLAAGAAAGIYAVLRARTRQQRLLALAVTMAVVVAAGSWGGWLAYDAWRPPSGYRILVSEFDGGKSSQYVGFARRIADRLSAQLSATGVPIEIKRTTESYGDAQTARAQGARQKAGIVIWGWYDDKGVSPNVEVLSLPPVGRSGSVLPIIFTTANAAGPGGGPPAALQPTLAKIAPVTAMPSIPPSLDLYTAYGPDQMAYIASTVLGMTYLANNDLDQARKLFDQALTSVAGDSGPVQGQEVVYVQRGLVNYRQGRYADARADFEAALKARADYPLAYANLAIVKADTCAPTRDLAGALADARQAVKLKPDDAAAQRVLAGLTLRSGDAQAALPIAEQARQLDPQSQATYGLLASIYDALGRPADAKAARETVLSLAQQAVSGTAGAAPAGGNGGAAVPGADAYYALGDAYLALERYDEARAAYQQALEHGPSDSRYHQSLGNVAYWQGDDATAIQEYQKQAAQAPTDPGPHLTLGIIYAKQGKNQEALAEYRTAAQLSDCDAAPYLLLGGALLNSGDAAGAREAYAKAVAINPDYLNGRYMLAGVAIFLRDYPTAAEQYRLIAERKPNDAQAQYYLASALDQAGRKEEAKPIYAKTAELWQQQGGVPTIELAYAYEKIGKLDEAIAVARQVTAQQAAAQPAAAQPAAAQPAAAQNETAYVHAYLGSLYATKGALEPANREYARAVELDAKQPLALLGLAQVASQRGDHAAAAAGYERYVQAANLNASDKAAAHEMAAFSYLQSGDLEAAYRHFADATQLTPDLPDMQRRLGDAALWLGKLDEADAALGKALLVQPDNAALYTSLAQVSYRRCDPADAAAKIEEAMRMTSTSLLSGTLAVYYDAIGKTDAANALTAQLAAQPANDLVAHWSAGARLAATDPVAARRELTQALAVPGLTPGFAAALHSTLGQLAFVQGDLPTATMEYTTARTLDADYIDAEIGLGDLALLQGDAGRTAALGHYQAALKRLHAYAAKYGYGIQPMLKPMLHARIALAQPPSSQEAAAALKQAEDEAAALLKSQPEWSAAQMAAGIVAFAAGDRATGDKQFAAALACDRTLAETQRRFNQWLEQVQRTVSE